MQIYRWSSLFASLACFIALASCYVPEDSGGYAAECELEDANGWRVSALGGLEQSIGPHLVRLHTRHLYYSPEVAALIQIFVYSSSRYPTQDIRLNLSQIILEVGNTKFHPSDKIREDGGKNAWRCGGTFTAESNLNNCGPAILTFPKPIPKEQGFMLHLGTLRIDGLDYEVPDIKYCHIPAVTRWVRFHG